jgi:hypothetical protein
MKWLHSVILLLVLASVLIISLQVSALDMFTKRHNRKLLEDPFANIPRNGKDTLKAVMEIAAGVVLEAGSVELIDLAVEGTL